MSRLIVIEGVDSSGKATQAQMLQRRLAESCGDVRLISFPDYESDFSLPVKRYLAGDLGEKPDEVNPYAASLLYAVDRFASFTRDWGDFYRQGGTIIADRYVTSNIVHQASKVCAQNKQEFISWLSELEYGRLGLPKPNLVLFLDMPPEYARELMKNRKNKITGEAKKDIHESDNEYISRSYKNAVSIAEELGWCKILCVRNGNVRKIKEISDEIYEKVKMAL